MEKRQTLYFFILLLAVSVLYGYPEIFFKHPSYHHLWRQSDCLSITLNYAIENRNFFTPAIHWVGSKDGRTISEFPIIYYTVAQLWKVFGQYETIFRLINILIVFSGLYCLFRFAREFLGDTFWAIFLPLFLFSSPILAYYTNNFLADAPALGLSLTGGYFFWKSFSSGKKKWYYLSFLFFLLAGLIKISSMLLFLSLFVVHMYVIFFHHREKNWFNRYARLLPYLGVIILILAWYRYTAWYNNHNLAGIFLQGLLPIWGVDAATRAKLWSVYVKDMIPAYFSLGGFYAVLLLFLAVFAFYRHVSKFLLAVTLFVFLGCVSLLLLFYQALTIHDYYSTNMLIFIPLPVIVFLDMLHKKYPLIYKSRALKIVVSIGLLFMLYTGAVTNRMKYNTRDALVKTNFIVNRHEIEEMEKFNDWFDSRYNALREIKPYLRSLGISRTDRVFSIPDNSINITLYMMDQKGLDDFLCSEMPYGKTKMDLVRELGCRYVIVNNTYICQDPGLAPYLTHLIGTFKNVNIYKLDQAAKTN
ncbi:MAG: glycosyltransferase family 39 protein [Bacteroidota bacterium]